MCILLTMRFLLFSPLRLCVASFKIKLIWNLSLHSPDGVPLHRLKLKCVCRGEIETKLWWKNLPYSRGDEIKEMFIVLALFMILASVHEGLFQVRAVSLLWCFVGTNFKKLTGWVRASLEFKHVVLGLSKLAVEIIKFYCYFL